MLFELSSWKTSVSLSLRYIYSLSIYIYCWHIIVFPMILLYVYVYVYRSNHFAFLVYWKLIRITSIKLLLLIFFFAFYVAFITIWVYMFWFELQNGFNYKPNIFFLYFPGHLGDKSGHIPCKLFLLFLFYESLSCIREVETDI
jgi:hypothetical protein